MSGQPSGVQSDAEADTATVIASKLGLEGDAESLEEMLSMPSVAFEILSQSYRRHTVQYLLDNESPVEISELARYVAARERQTSPAAVTAGERDEVAVRLVHVHVPKMVDFDLIEWIPERDEILLATGEAEGIEEESAGTRDAVGDAVEEPDTSPEK